MEKEEIYIGTKVIKAIRMDEVTFLRVHKGKTDIKQENRLGYRVTYPDGYISWSPKEQFEMAYRIISNGEWNFLLPPAETEIVNDL